MIQSFLADRHIAFDLRIQAGLHLCQIHRIGELNNIFRGQLHYNIEGCHIFNNTFGTQITVVPVDGASDSRDMFLAGDTDIFFASISDVMSAYQSGDMKILCLFADERSDFMPDVPAVKEATGEEFVAFAARGYFYPQGVDPEIVTFMTDAIIEASKDEEYINNMAALGYILVSHLIFLGFQRFIHAQHDIRGLLS